MVIFVIIIVCVALMALFFAVTIAGGKAHDRANAEAASRARVKAALPSAPDDAGTT
ncbi:MAG: hypothetical protein WC729_26015 [Sphingomonas sp.]|jgi:hypothetical protein|uniref:hypothetical protein n=1 Tax=Sphingomonas sp. TaxID=28214 RepID=UPI003568871B